MYVYVHTYMMWFAHAQGWPVHCYVLWIGQEFCYVRKKGWGVEWRRQHGWHVLSEVLMIHGHVLLAV